MNPHRFQEPLYWVGARRMANAFPPANHALDDPNGLLAIGGDLGIDTLLAAYRRGIFPWYSPGQPILWWSPDPRAVLLPPEVHVSHSLAKRLRQGGFVVDYDRDFAAVIDACAAPRESNTGTWITTEMRRAYLALHAAGHAHSVEVWRDGELCGGLYGVAIGRVFFGESMFSRARDCSKIALVTLCRALEMWSFALLDCQVHTTHLQSLGARDMRREDFVRSIATFVEQAPGAGAWQARASAP